MIGQLFAGRYRVVSSLGHGAMGAVWLAHDEVLGRQIAIKQLRADPSRGIDAEDVARMQREARTAAQLRHRNIVTVFDLVEADGQPYVLMEYVEGESLADRIRREGPLPLHDVTRIGAEIASALALAHRRGVIHRDVKPANILLSEDGAMLADFGIARSLGDVALTQTGHMIGTIAYMAPEVARFGQAWPASDVYSLGATLFAAIEGRAPFDDGSNPNTTQMLLRIVTEVAPRSPRAGMLADLIAAMLDHGADRRPYATDVAAWLEGALRHQSANADHSETARTHTVDGAAARTDLAGSATPSQPAATADSDDERPGAGTTTTAVPPPATVPRAPLVQADAPPPRREGRGRRTVAIVAAVLVVVAGAVVTAVVLGGDDSGPSAPLAGSAGRPSSGAATASRSSSSKSAAMSTTPLSTTPLAAVLPAGDGSASCPAGTAIAYIGTINGDSAALGQGIRNGAALAVRQHNAANPSCQVALKSFDTQGSPDTASSAAAQAIGDSSVRGVVGLPFSGETQATEAAFDRAGLVTITPSATRPDVARRGSRSFFRAIGNDFVQAAPATALLKGTSGDRSVCVVRDDSDYGKGLAADVARSVGSSVICTDEVQTGQSSFSGTVAKIVGADADVVYFAGYYPEAAGLVKQLRAGGYEGTFVAPDGSKDPEFVKGAGVAAAEGSYFTCVCAPADVNQKLTQEYEAAFGMSPTTYVAEAYDAATIELAGIDAGQTTRAALLNWVRNYDDQGVTKYFRFTAIGELAGTPAVWLYRVSSGDIVPVRRLS